MQENEDRFSKETIILVIIFLLIVSIFELFMIVGYLDIINDKNNYILKILENQHKLKRKYPITNKDKVPKKTNLLLDFLFFLFAITTHLLYLIKYIIF